MCPVLPPFMPRDLAEDAAHDDRSVVPPPERPVGSQKSGGYAKQPPHPATVEGSR